MGASAPPRAIWNGRRADAPRAGASDRRGRRREWHPSRRRGLVRDGDRSQPTTLQAVCGVAPSPRWLLRQVMFARRPQKKVSDEAEFATGAERLDIMCLMSRGARTNRRKVARSFASTDSEAVLAHLPDIVFRVDRKFRHVYVGGAVHRIRKLHPEQFIGKSGRELGFPSDLCDSFEAACRAVLRTGKPRAFDALIDGVWVSHRLIPERDTKGRIKSILGFAEDVTERRSAAEALRRSEDRLRRIAFETDAVGVLFLNKEGVLIDANDVFLRMTGYTRAEVSTHQMTWRTFTPEEWVPDSVAQWEGLSRTGRIGPYETEYLRKDGSRAWMLFAGRDLGDGAIVEYAIDTTERKRAENALRETEEHFHALVRASSDVVFRMSPDWKEMKYLVGRDFIPDTLEPSQPWLQKYIPPDDQKHFTSTIRKALRTRSVFELEHRVWRVDGSLGWTHSRAIPIFDAEGRIIEWFGMSSDVTARRHAEDSLRASEERFRVAQELSPDGFFVLRPNRDADGSVADFVWVYANATVASMTGSVPKQLVGRRLLETFPSISGTSFFKAYKQVAETGKPAIVEDLYQGESDRHRRWFRTAVVRTGEDIAVLIHEITARKQTEAALRESEEHLRDQAARLKAILDTAADAIITIDERGIIQSVNPAAERIFGYADTEMLGRNVSMLMPPPHRDNHDEYLNQHLRTGKKRIIGIGREAHGLRKDGSTFPIDLSVSEVVPKKLFTGVIRDTTDRLAAAQHLREAERMSSIGTLAAGLGHDMNNMLLPLRAHLNVVAAADAAPKVRRRMQQINQIVDYLQQLADGLHYLAADGGPVDAPGSTNLHEWWEQVGLLLSKSVPRHVRVEAALPGSLPPVAIAAHRLTQAVLNLIVNAGQAIRPPSPTTAANRRSPRKARASEQDRHRTAVTGTVYVSATVARHRGNSGSRASAGMVRLVIRDNGTGMTDEARRRAFELFFTTKPRTMGTGLGLPLVARIVSGAGGSVDIDSAPGRGTSVTLNLPVAPARHGSGRRGSRRRPRAMIASIAVSDQRAASLIRQVLHSAGVATPTGTDPHDADLWIVEPERVTPDDAARWRTRRDDADGDGTLVVVGPLARREAPHWEAIAQIIIDRPEDYFCIRDCIRRAVQHRYRSQGIDT